MRTLLTLSLLLLLAGVTHSQKPRDGTAARTNESSKSRGKSCPSEAVSLIKRASSSPKYMSDFDKTCASDSGCYAKCFCMSLKKSVSVLREAKVDRKSHAWRPCLRQSWKVMIEPRVPKKALEAWSRPNCKNVPEQKCPS